MQFTNLSDYLENLNSLIIRRESNIENIDIMAGFYLGLMASKEIDGQSFLYFLTNLFNKKMGIKFIDRFISITGSTAMTQTMKEKFLVDPNPINIISDLNNITGKKEATLAIKPYEKLLNKSSFHQEFLEYETKAHHQLVGVLINRLRESALLIPSNLTINKENNPTTLKNLYKPSNINKSFVSIDLKQANWTAIRYWDPSLPEWSDFVKNILPDSNLKDLFVNSKMFRQITLGVAMKKVGIISKIEATQVMLIDEMYNNLDPFIGEPFSRSNDELIFEWPWPLNEIKDYFFPAFCDPNFKITYMKLIEKTYDNCYVFYYKELKNSKEYTLLRMYSPEKVEERLK